MKEKTVERLKINFDAKNSDDKISNALVLNMHLPVFAEIQNCFYSTSFTS